MKSTKNVRECPISECLAWCCRQFWIILPEKPDKDMKRYLELHDVKVDGKKLTIPLECQNLSEFSLECDDYKNRPEFCKKFRCKNPKNSEEM